MKNTLEPGNVWIDNDAHGDPHKAWRDFTREATFEIYKDWPIDDGRSALLYMVKHFVKHGGDGLSWLANWLRLKEINEHERTSIEMRCFITCLYLSGTYDQLNSPCLASVETVARRIAQIVEAYSGEAGKKTVGWGSSPRRPRKCHGLYRSEFASCCCCKKTAKNWTLKCQKEHLPPRVETAKNGGLEA